MKLSLEQLIRVFGVLKITSIDAITGEVLSVDEGHNLILNTGLQDLCYLLAGNITVPTDLSAGSDLNMTDRFLNHVPLYGQFGVNGAPPSLSDHSQFGNGTLDNNVVTPLNASEIIRVSSFFPANNKVTFQFFLMPGQGNGIGSGAEGRIYREAVLMSKVQDDPLIFRWFARRQFADVIKNSSTIISAEWTFTFVSQEST